MKREVKNVKENVKETAVNAVKTVQDTAAKVEKRAGKATKAAAKTMKAAEVKAEETVKAASEAVKKAPGRRTVKETIYLQYMGREINKDDLVDQVKTIWTKDMNRKASEMKEITLYLKTEDNAAYYVINGEVTGKIAL